MPGCEENIWLLEEVGEPAPEEGWHGDGRWENGYTDGSAEGGLGGECAVGVSNSDSDRELSQPLADFSGARLHFAFAGWDNEGEERQASGRDIVGRIADSGEDSVDVGFFFDCTGAVFGVVQFESIFGQNAEHDGCDIACGFRDQKEGEQVQQVERLVGVA